jgi:hypothetical protein
LVIESGSKEKRSVRSRPFGRFDQVDLFQSRNQVAKVVSLDDLGQNFFDVEIRSKYLFCESNFIL